jgi:hypothetical protein
MENQSNLKQYLNFTLKVIVAHTFTYFIFGLIMSNIFDYQAIWQQDVIKDFMRPYDSPWIMAGPFLQPIRGIIFAIGIWPIREIIFNKKHGWLTLWGIIVVFGILSTPAAAPCSIEGLLYTQLPLWFHLIGLPEIMLQTLLFSLLLTWWMKRNTNIDPNKPVNKYSRLLLLIMFSVMIGCFGYIGYAIGAILTAKLAGVTINVSGDSVSLKSQMMFVFAFFINTFSLIVLIAKQYYDRFSLWILFLVFWLIDTAAPLLYQAIAHRMMPFHMALLMGFFPALIITLSIKFNVSKFEQIKNSN